MAVGPRGIESTLRGKFFREAHRDEGIAHFSCCPTHAAAITRPGHGAPSRSLLPDSTIDLTLTESTIRRVLLAPPPEPRGVIVMLPGGSGNIGFARDGSARHDLNFVVRTRALWNQRRYAVLITDSFGGKNLKGSEVHPAMRALSINLCATPKIGRRAQCSCSEPAKARSRPWAVQPISFAAVSAV